MKKSLICLLVLTFNLFLVSVVSASVRINEVELNPYDTCNDCTEWLELYSNEEVNLNGWKVIDASNKIFNLTGNINGYKVFENITLSLNNGDEKLSLYNQNELIQESPLISDSDNNNKSWQYCNGNWNFTYSTRGFENACSSQNNTPNPQQNNTNNQENSISLSLNWNEDDIVNSEEFDIEVRAEDLGDKKYDIKIWIEDDGKVISDRYDEENNEWKSGTYYINNFFQGSGNKTGDARLKIREDYSDFSGNAEIYIKLREGGEISKTIEILKKNENEKKGVNNESEEIKISQPIKSNSSITGGVIKLGSSNPQETENVKDEKNTANTKLVYESKNERIKIYAIIGFAVLCLGLVILMVLKKIK